MSGFMTQVSDGIGRRINILTAFERRSINLVNVFGLRTFALVVSLVGWVMAPASAQVTDAKTEDQAAAGESYLNREWYKPSTQLGDRERAQTLNKILATLREAQPGSVDYTRALSELQKQILDSPEDGFIAPGKQRSDVADGVADSPAQLPRLYLLKDVAEHVLAELPAGGRENYELQFGSEAAGLLNQARATGDLAALRSVAERFLHTKAGGEAAYQLGTAHFDARRPLSAIKILERLTESSDARQRWEPGLSLKLAVAWYQAGYPQKSKETLERLRPWLAGNRERLPSSLRNIPFERLAEHIHSHVLPPEISLAESDTALGTNTSISVASKPVTVAGDPLWDISSLGFSDVPTPEQLKVYRYDAENTEAEYEPPTPNTQAELAALVQVGHEWLQRADQQTNERPLPAQRPLVASGMAVFRTLSRVRAVDLRTGQTKWETSAEDPAYSDLFVLGKQWKYFDDRVPRVHTFSPLPRFQHAYLEMRTRHDRAMGSLSTDGRLVFYLDACGVPHPATAMGYHGARAMIPQGWNRLIAVELATGRTAWESGAPSNADDESSTGDFFLGVPTVVDGLLYVLIENRGDVRLACLDPRDGRELWRQPIAQPAESIRREPLRRIAGDRPHHVSGWLICPTTAGLLVAYDLTGRRLSWAYGYDTAVIRPYQRFRQGLPGRVIPQELPVFDLLSNDDRWLENTLVTSAGRVYVTMLDSKELHCLDLLSGKLLWKAPRLRGVYLADVSAERVIIVDRNQVRALHAVSGEALWTIPLVDWQPAGRGMRFGANYLLPVTTDRNERGERLGAGEGVQHAVLTIDLAEGRVTSRMAGRGETAFGNLIEADGVLVGQTYDRVTAFPPLEEAAASFAKRLADRPDDAEMLARRGQLRLQKGESELGLADLVRSLELEPRDDVRQLVVDVSLERLRRGRVQPSELGELFKQIGAPVEIRLRLIASEADALADKGDLVAAFQKLLEFADDPSAEGDGKREIQGSVARFGLVIPTSRMAELWRRATAAGQLSAVEQIEAIIRERGAAAIKSGGLDAIRRFIRVFGWHPVAWEARWELVSSDRLLPKKNFLERERHASALSRAEQADIAVAGALALFSHWIETDHADAAVQAFDWFERRMRDYKLADGTSGIEKLRTLQEMEPVQQRHSHGWPDTVKVETSESSRDAPSRNFVPVLGTVSPAIRGWNFEVESRITEQRQQQRIVARDRLGREKWAIPLGSDTNRTLGMEPLTCLSHGHLLAVSVSGRVVVFDISEPDQPRPMWVRDVLDFSSTAADIDVGLVPGWHVSGHHLSRWQGRLMVWRQRDRQQLSGSVDLMTSEYVLYRTDSRLFAVDNLSGTTVWTRSDVSPQARIIGDDDHVLLISENGNAQVLRLIDGELVKAVSLPPFENHVSSAGRDLVAWRPTAQKQELTRIDSLSGQPVWRHEYSEHAVVQVLNLETIFVLEPSGRLQICDSWTGELLADVAVPPEPQLRHLHAMPSQDGYIVVTDTVSIVRQPLQNQMPQAGRLHSDVRGHVFAIGRDGQLGWVAEVPLQGISVEQPCDLPLLVFQRQRPRQSGQPEHHVLILDKRTGQELVKEALQRPATGYSIDANPEKNSIELVFGRQRFALQYGNE